MHDLSDHAYEAWLALEKSGDLLAITKYQLSLILKKEVDYPCAEHYALRTDIDYSEEQKERHRTWCKYYLESEFRFQESIEKRELELIERIKELENE